MSHKNQCLVLLSVIVFFLTALELKSNFEVGKSIQNIQAQLSISLLSHTDKTQFPRSTKPDGSLSTVTSDDWVSGFYPGSLWYMYDYTKDPKWEKAAREWTANLEKEKSNATTHDLGFMLYCSFGNGSREDQSRVREAMAWAGVDGLARRDVSELSGGERRRVTLARARAQGARALLFDEPTAFLDPMQQWWVAEAIAKMVRDERLAAVMVLHDPAMALRYCTHAAMLRGGAVLAQGPIESVLTSERLLEVFDVEARVGRDAASGVPYVVTVRGASGER